MPKVIFILGLCGSGKSTLADKMLAQNPSIHCIDERFVQGVNPDFDEKYDLLIENLRNGNHCIVIENAYLIEEGRNFIKQKITQDLPHIKFKWIFFEND